MRAQLKWVVGLNTFEICVMNADGTNLVQLTDNALFEGTGDVVSGRVPHQEIGTGAEAESTECRVSPLRTRIERHLEVLIPGARDGHVR
jgi:hypothetical protein